MSGRHQKIVNLNIGIEHLRIERRKLFDQLVEAKRQRDEIRKETVDEILTLLEKYYDGEGRYQALGLVDAIVAMKKGKL